MGRLLSFGTSRSSTSMSTLEIGCVYMYIYYIIYYIYIIYIYIFLHPSPRRRGNGWSTSRFRRAIMRRRRAPGFFTRSKTLDAGKCALQTQKNRPVQTPPGLPSPCSSRLISHRTQALGSQMVKCEDGNLQGEIIGGLLEKQMSVPLKCMA